MAPAGRKAGCLDGDWRGDPQIQEEEEHDPGGDGGQAGSQRAGGE